MKYLFLIVFALVIYWLIKRNRARDVERDAPQPPPVAPPAESMVRCAHCGVHLPRTEAVGEGERLYCSEQHRQLARPPE